MTVRVYLDKCCLNRPFDDDSQARIRDEKVALAAIGRLFITGKWHWIGSEVLAMENEMDRNAARREEVAYAYSHCHEYVQLAEIHHWRAWQLAMAGFSEYDAFHVAVAELASCDVLLTTDDRLVKKARRTPSLMVRVENPVQWAVEKGLNLNG